MTEFYDDRETRDPQLREADLFSRLPTILAHARDNATAWRHHLAGVDPAAVTSRAALAGLPVLRKPQLMEAQKAAPPFGGFTTTGVEGFGRVFMSPGPVWEPQGEGSDPWKAARALFAAGFREGHVIHNAFAYHLTPGGFILDTGARALGCAVFPAGVGNTDTQVEAMAALRPDGYVGTPDFLKVLLDKAAETARDVSSVRQALVSGGALFPSLRQEYAARGVAVLQCYATADLGTIAYESEAQDGMIVNEEFIVEIVRPGTGEPVPDGEVGELMVTSFNRTYPLIRFGTGDLSAVLPGTSPCGRTNMRIRGWMGRADQRTKVKGMFVDPAQINEVAKRFPALKRLRLVVTREGEQDALVLRAESAENAAGLAAPLAEALQTVCKVRGHIEIVAPGSLPNDGKVISDERSYG